MENLTTKKTVIGGDDSAVIKKYIYGYEGGRCLEMGDNTVVKSGTVILRTYDGKFKPAPVSGTTYNYKSSDKNEKVAGILYGTVTSPRQAASIMTWGIVNSKLLPYPLTADIKAALPHIDEMSDADETWEHQD